MNTILVDPKDAHPVVDMLSTAGWKVFWDRLSVMREADIQTLQNWKTKDPDDFRYIQGRLAAVNVIENFIRLCQEAVKEKVPA